MTSEQLRRQWQRIVLDLQELAEDPYLDSDSRERLRDAIKELEGKDRYVYSTEV